MTPISAATRPDFIIQADERMINLVIIRTSSIVFNLAAPLRTICTFSILYAPQIVIDMSHIISQPEYTAVVVSHGLAD